VRLGVLGIEGLTRLVYLKRKNKKMSSALSNTDLTYHFSGFAKRRVSRMERRTSHCQGEKSRQNTL